MAWTPPADAIETKPAKAWTPPADAIETKPAAPAGPKEAPGWFQPGSKSEALVRGFSQGATLGFGDEIQALIRNLGTDQTYAQVRDQERDANAASAQANPGSYIAGNVAAAIPTLGGATSLVGRGLAALPARAGTTAGSLARGTMQTPTIATAAKAGAGVGAVSGLGSGEGDAGDQLLNAGKGAALGALATGGAAGLAQGTNRVGAALAGTSQRGAGLRGGVANAAADRMAGAAVGAAGTAVVGGDPIMGALGGATVGAKKLGDLAGPATKFVAKGLTKVGPSIRNVGGQAGRGVSVANATTLALQNMTGQQARQVTSKATEEIQAAVARGQPQYAATFQALQSPETRQAVMVEEDDELVLETGDEE